MPIDLFLAQPELSDDEPPWLAEYRATARNGVDLATMPSDTEEVWRYSPIDDLPLDRIVTTCGRPTSPPGIEVVAALVPNRSAVVHVHNGWLVSIEGGVEGLFVGPVSEAEGGHAILGAAMSEPTDVFATANNALCPQPLAIISSRNALIAEPVVVLQTFDDSDAVAFPRLIVSAGENSALSVVSIQTSNDAFAGLVAPVVELIAHQAANLGFLEIQQLGTEAWQIASQVSKISRDATITASVAAVGGHYSRVRTDCRLAGQGATGNLVSLYYGDGRQTLDFRTFQDHAAPDTTSNLLFKGALDDDSKSVYTGLIRVRPNARGTNAFQTNRNLKLSENAWAESVPNLEIENNDVKCSHASTVSPIDPDQRFYLESRGVPPVTAERLVLGGFFDEVLAATAVPSASHIVRDLINAKILHGADQ